MSVYIKEFPLPNNCGACPLRLAWCRERIYMVNRPDRCPLVPVPPHGDLIDRREAIIDANERAYDFWLSDDEVNATIQFLKEQTTIIPSDTDINVLSKEEGE